MSFIYQAVHSIEDNFVFDSDEIEIVGGLAQLKAPIVTTNPTIVGNTYIVTDDLTLFISSISGTGGDVITGTIRLNGQPKYWDGAAWVDSDDTFAQSSTFADIATNIATLVFPSTGSSRVSFKSFLHSNNGTTTPTLTNFTVAYGLSASTLLSPDKTTVTGNLSLLDGEVRPSQTVSFSLNTDVESNSFLTVKSQQISIRTDSDGNFSQDLVPGTYTMDIGGVSYPTVVIPNQATIDIIDLIP